MAKKKVLIVRQTGPIATSEYDGLIDELIDIITKAIEGKGVKLEVVETIEEAQGSLQEKQITSLVFLSIRMLSKAEDIAKEHQDVKVRIFSDSVLENEPIGVKVIYKKSATPNLIRAAVL